MSFSFKYHVGTLLRQALQKRSSRSRVSWFRSRGRYKYAFAALFVFLACLNLFVMVQANQLAFSQGEARQPFDFYVLLHASSQVFNAPSQLYVWQTQSTVGPYWAKWLWNGSNYAYTPMLATFLSPFSSAYPPEAKLVWELLSYALLLVSCVLIGRLIPSPVLRSLVTILILLMPIPLLYANQPLPQNWGAGVTPGMLISPVYFADYNNGNTNTMTLSLALLSFYFGAQDALGRSVDLGGSKLRPYVLSSLFLALDTFKVTAFLLILPFWLVLNRKKIDRSLAVFVAFVLALNGAALIHPVLISAYLSKLALEASISTSLSPLWQVYEYVWYYTIPLTGIVTILSLRKRRPSDTSSESRPTHLGAMARVGPLLETDPGEAIGCSCEVERKPPA